MRLNRLSLDNFGLYRGRQTIELAPRTKYGKVRPLVLIGGHNGAGKTTILEALRLCLYGRLALGPRVHDTDYHTYLRERIHRDRGALIQPKAASVALEFDYARGGQRASYLVERAWTISGDVIREDLTVMQDGKPLADVESQFWADFVRSLVPPGLSQLFFFDGEKIQRLAEDASDSETLAESVKALLGLDLVERLQADLDLYISREVKRSKTGAQASRLVELESGLAEIEAKLTTSKQDRAQAKTQLEYLEKELARVEQKLSKEGHALAGHGGELRQRKTDLTERAAAMAKSLREICEGPLPVAACPKLAKALLIQLDREESFERWNTSREEVARVVTALSARLKSGSLAKKLRLDPKTSRAIAAEVRRVGEDISTPSPVHRDFSQVHALSASDREVVKSSLLAARDRDAVAARSACREIAALEARLRDVQGHLKKVPDGDHISPLVSELAKLHDEHTAAQLLAEKRTDLLVALEKEAAQIRRERARILAAEKSSEELGERIVLAEKSRRSLEEYLKRLTAVKVSQLETVTMDCFNRLCRKTDLVKAIHIDPTTFAVELTDQNGQRIPKTELSAGEKQIYAISVLWALAKVSGRPLPMIIDTPLGRLDSIHRQKLVENYFPAAAHQVVVLSTDTEVDRGCYEALQPHISHAVHLKNHAADGWTEAVPGYFGEEANCATVTA